MKLTEIRKTRSAPFDFFILKARECFLLICMTLWLELIVEEEQAKVLSEPNTPRDDSNLYSCEKSGLNSMVPKTKERLDPGKEIIWTKENWQVSGFACLKHFSSFSFLTDTTDTNYI